MDKKSIPGAVLGIIGAVLALIGGLGLALCADLLAAAGEGSYTAVAYILGIGSAVIGMIGAILDFKKALVGGIMLAAALVCVLVVSIVMYFSIVNIIAMVLLGAAAVCSFVVQKDA